MRISILAGARPRDRIRWCRLISHMSNTSCRRGGPYVSTTTADATAELYYPVGCSKLKKTDCDNSCFALTSAGGKLTVEVGSL